MKAASIIAMGKILKDNKDKLDFNFIWEATTLIMLLIKDKNREVYRAVLQFLKIYIKIVSKENFHKNLRDLMVAIFEWDEDGRENSKFLLRHFMEKSIRKIVIYL